MKSYSKTMLTISRVVIISSVVSVGVADLTPEEEQLLHKHFIYSPPRLSAYLGAVSSGTSYQSGECAQTGI